MSRDCALTRHLPHLSAPTPGLLEVSGFKPGEVRRLSKIIFAVEPDLLEDADIVQACAQPNRLLEIRDPDTLYAAEILRCEPDNTSEDDRSWDEAPGLDIVWQPRSKFLDLHWIAYPRTESVVLPPCFDTSFAKWFGREIGRDQSSRLRNISPQSKLDCRKSLWLSGQVTPQNGRASTGNQQRFRRTRLEGYSERCCKPPCPSTTAS